MRPKLQIRDRDSIWTQEYWFQSVWSEVPFLKESHHFSGSSCTALVLVESLKLEEGDLKLARVQAHVGLKQARGNAIQSSWVGVEVGWSREARYSRRISECFIQNKQQNGSCSSQSKWKITKREGFRGKRISSMLKAKVWSARKRSMWRSDSLDILIYTWNKVMVKGWK